MRVFSILIFLAISMTTAAQHSVSGRVTNAAGEPLIQASVFVVESQYATITDDDGYYSLTDLAAGDHTIKASYVGYKAFEDYIFLPEDSIININLGENNLYLNTVSISTNRVNEEGAFASTTLTAEEFQKENLGQDVPYLLRWTPSTVVTSDAGTGIGYTGLRIRGTDATRINVTINGVPLNDAESQGVFWVDLPDLAASVDDVQVVRGVGTSTNGAGAFGGTVSLNTDQIHQNNYIEANGTVGSFGTTKASVSLGTGLINNKFFIDGRYSSIKSDGFIDRASADLRSYYIGAGRVTDKSSLKFITFSGTEVTYQAWNGVPEDKALGNEEAAQAHFDWNYGPFSYNLYRNAQDSLNYFESDDRTYNSYQYDNQVDDYTQTHYQLHHLLSASDKLTFKTTAYYTKGKGFFEQFRYRDDFAFYGLPETNSQGVEIPTADTLVRRKWLDNDLFGGIFTAKRNIKDGYVQLGLNASRYDGLHFGRVIYAQGFGLEAVNRRYYENTGIKDDLSAYLKYDQSFGSVNVFADMQIRKVNYSVSGIDDDLNELSVDKQFDFINPKFGISYRPTERQSAYASLAIANREPDRQDIINISELSAKSEQLMDIEFGYRYTGSKWKLEWNNYFMNYNDQLVLSGALDDVGNPRRINVDKSYRLGAELSATGEIYSDLYWNINTTLSQNRIDQFNEDIDGIIIPHSDTDIAFSPSVVIGNAFLYKPSEELDVEVSTKYVGKQYLDNTSNEERKLDPYTYTNLRIAYQLKPAFLQSVKLTFQVNNLLNAKYSSNGYTYSYDAGEIITENFLYPQAGIHFMLGAQVRL